MTHTADDMHDDSPASRPMTIDSKALEACPFCGNPEPEEETVWREIPAGGMGMGTTAGMIPNHIVHCRKCGATAPSVVIWNSRATNAA